MLGLFGCNNKKSDIVFDKFKTQIERQGMKIDSVDNEGLLHISKGELTLKISLENTRRDYERDSDETVITDLVNTIISYSADLPDWSSAKSDIYVSLFPSDFDFQEFIHRKITEEFSKVYVHSANDKLSWISKDDIKKWNITEDELDKQANQNFQLMLDKATISFDTIEGRKLGMIEAEHTTLKSSLLFAPNIKEKVSKDFGFPFTLLFLFVTSVIFFLKRIMISFQEDLEAL
jgi:hypothetical protein